MWIFGYGSLMFDGWEAACGCIDRKWANLPGYRRSFNKKSVESRGTRATPGLTLNLARAEGEICRGIAFAFEDNDQTQKILRGLEKREACKPRALRVQLEEGKEVTAQVFIYEGHNLIGSMPVHSAAQRSECDGLVTTGGAPSYVELLTCLEMAKQANELPEDSKMGNIGRY